MGSTTDLSKVAPAFVAMVHSIVWCVMLGTLVAGQGGELLTWSE